MLYITPGFPSSESDSNCLPPLQSFIRGWSPHDVQAMVISLAYPGHGKPYRWHDIPVFDCGKTGNLPRRHWRSFRSLRTYLRLIRIGKSAPDLVHSFWANDAAIWGGFAASFFDIPHLNTLMGQDATATNAYRHIWRLLPLRAIALSDRHAYHWQNLVGRSVEDVIPWGLDKEAVVIPQSDEKKYDLIGVGNMTLNKDYLTFVKVVDKLREDLPDLRAILIGDGAMYDQIRSEIDKRNLSTHLTLMGKLDRQRTLKLMSQASILLHTAHFESFGYVFSEAQFFGLGIVSRPVGQAPQNDHSHWKLAEDVSGMVKGIKSLLRQSIMSHTATSLSMQDTCQLYLDAYHKLLSGSAP